MIQFDHVSKTFGKNQVLSDVTFTIDQGNFVTIIGASGCGKTTTLKMINRLIKPTAGEIYIGGENIRDKDILQLRRSMGYVIQQTGLFSHMTVRENIEIIPRLSKADPERTRTRTLELMDLVGMDPDQYLDRYPTELSGGQQQRIGVARAFAMDPEIILMDEPFSALDPITRTQLQDELLGLQEELHKTIVFVTHDMDEAVKIADKICVMDKGKILQYDEPEQLLKNPCNEFVAQFVGKNRIWSSPEFIKARDIMIKLDKKRSSYYNYYASKRWGDSRSYDLCINSSAVGIDGAVKIILEFAKLKQEQNKAKAAKPEEKKES